MINSNEEYGIVYVLSNPAMPSLVKIGMTNRNDINLRLQELYNTSVPVPFVCEYACKVLKEDCTKIERALHIAFNPNRTNPSREFFEIEPEQAIAILKLLDRTEDITTEVVKESEESLSSTDKDAGIKLRRRKRPPLNFKEMGIPLGSSLEFVDEEIRATATVSAERKVSYNEEERSLTNLTQELLNLEYAVQPTPYWQYQGKNLLTIYNDTYEEIE